METQYEWRTTRFSRSSSRNYRRDAIMSHLETRCRRIFSHCPSPQRRHPSWAHSDASDSANNFNSIGNVVLNPALAPTRALRRFIRPSNAAATTTSKVHEVWRLPARQMRRQPCDPRTPSSLEENPSRLCRSRASERASKSIVTSFLTTAFIYFSCYTFSRHVLGRPRRRGIYWPAREIFYSRCLDPLRGY